MTARGALGAPLTERQAQTLRMAANGMTHRQIARELGIAEKSVSSLVNEILVRLGAGNMAHAVFLACRDGILDPRRRHGDHAGFIAHKRRGEVPCDDCQEGERAYRRAYRAARRIDAA